MPDDFDIENYTKEVFFMFSGEKVLVDLRCDNSLMKTMVDRFGEDVTTLQGHFTDTVHMPVCRCKINPFLAAVTACRTVKVSIHTRIGLVKDADKIILHSCFVLHVKAELTVHGFKLIA